MKKLLIILGILVLLVIGVLFVPPIYNRFTKPFFKNTVDAKEWYHQVDCENLTQVRDYCDRRGYSTDYYILVDFSKPSGKKRFFIYDLQRGIRVMSSYCMHGSGKGNTAAQPKFSNNPGSGCTSLGRYVMIGKGGMKFKNCVRLRGLDKSNYLAEARGILIHSAGKVTRFSGEKEYIPLGNREPWLLYCIKELRGESDVDIQGIFQEKTGIDLCKIQINRIFYEEVVVVYNWDLNPVFSRLLQ